MLHSLVTLRIIANIISRLYHFKQHLTDNVLCKALKYISLSFVFTCYEFFVMNTKNSGEILSTQVFRISDEHLNAPPSAQSSTPNPLLLIFRIHIFVVMSTFAVVAVDMTRPTTDCVAQGNVQRSQSWVSMCVRVGVVELLSVGFSVLGSAVSTPHCD